MRITTATVGLPDAFLARYAGLAHEPADTRDQRVHRCYELAGHAVLTWNLLGWATTLVHGTIRDPGNGLPPNPHGWAEFQVPGVGRFAWEPVTDTVAPLRDYQRAWGARRWTTYTPAEARALFLEHEHFGVWGRVNTDRYDRAAARLGEALAARDAQEAAA